MRCVREVSTRQRGGDFAGYRSGRWRRTVKGRGGDFLIWGEERGERNAGWREKGGREVKEGGGGGGKSEGRVL